MGWLIALGILILLGILPLGVSASYNMQGFFLKVIIGPVRISLLPTAKNEKKKKEIKTPAKNTARDSEKPVKKQHSKEGGDVKDFLPLVEIALKLLNDFRRKLRVNCLELKLILAGDDPCDLSINYGKAWTALGNVMPQLERVLIIKKRNLEIECDYLADKPVVYARIDLTITLGRLLYIALRYGGHALFKYIKIMNQRKGGAVQ